MTGKRKYKRLTWALLVFALLVSSTRAYASQSSVTIDLTGGGQVDQSKLSGRSFLIWKLSDDNYSDEGRETLQLRLKDVKQEALTKEFDQPIQAGPSDVQGKIQVSLDKGTYYLREVQTSEELGYFPLVISIKEGEEYLIKPKPYHKEVKLSKVSQDGTKLAGAEFELYQVKGNKKLRVPLKKTDQGFAYEKEGRKDLVLVTGEKGEIHISKLPPGDYIFKEIKAPKDYVIVQAETAFTISPSEGTKEVLITNYKEGHKFQKVSEDKKPLEGAQFLVTQKEGDKYVRVQREGRDYVLSSDSEGYFTVTGLKDGTYYLWETQPPKGYEALSGPVELVVDGPASGRVIVVSNRRIPLRPPESPLTPPPKPLEPPKTPSTNPPPLVPEEPTVPSPRKPLASVSPIRVPKTGDITLLLLAGAGMALSAGGYQLIKDNKDK